MEWEKDNAKTVTFVVTKNCQLACKYCYLTGKNEKEKMTWDTAKSAVDYVLAQYGKEGFYNEAVIFDFIGGEPFLEIDLIDQLCDYIKYRLYETNIPWFNLYRFSFSTNGINYHTEKVQRFIQKNLKHLSIGFSIDGTKEKHDLNRIWKGNDERGSYEDVVANVPLWLKQFPQGATKVTISSEDIPYISQSVLHLFSLGIHQVNINCVFEDVWKDGDDVLFEQQLKVLAEEIVARKLYMEYKCSFFDRNIGRPLDLCSENGNWCGCGRMLAIDPKGLLYPCNRFIDFALTYKQPRYIGSIYTGIDRNKLRPFLCLDRVSQSPLKCLNCEVASGCSWCQGENYDSAPLSSIYLRSTAICKMHKARVRANNYFWGLIDCNDFDESKKQPNHNSMSNNVEQKNTYYCASDFKQATILLSSNSNSICGYFSKNNENEFLKKNALCRFLKYAENRNIEITVVYPSHPIPEEIAEILDSYSHNKILSGKDHCLIIPMDNENSYKSVSLTFLEFYDSINTLSKHLDLCRLNIYLYDYNSFDELKYRESLAKLKNEVLLQWKNGHKIRVNIISDPMGLRSNKECKYGTKAFVLAPNGNFYLCPAYYYDNDNQNAIGSIYDELYFPATHLLHREYSPVCRSCKENSCLRCTFENHCRTLEYNIPSYEQCCRSQIEHEISFEFYKEL